MRRMLSILAVGAAAAAGILAAASPARGESINPPLPGTATQNCLTCPPDLVASVTRYHDEYGIPYWKVEITNLGSQSAPSSSASVTYRMGWNINTTTVAVAPLGGFQTRVVYSLSAWTTFVLSACADSLGDVSESNETNNCASPT